MARFLAVAPALIDAFCDAESSARGMFQAGVKPMLDTAKAAMGLRILSPTIQGTTATVEVQGNLYASVPMMLRWFGMAATSTRELRSVIDDLTSNPDVSAITLLIDSPGGDVMGTFEAAAAITRARAAGKTVAVQASGRLCSAAYLIASAADSITCSPMTEVGSIGVVAVVQDTSARDNANGVTRTVIASGQNKGLGMDGKVTDQVIASVQARVDQLAAAFQAQVAASRTMDAATVASLATGDTWLADQAQKLGLIDAVDAAAAAFDVGADTMDPTDDDTGMHAAVRPPATTSTRSTTTTPNPTHPTAITGQENPMSLLSLCAEFPAFAAEINALHTAKTPEADIITQIRGKAAKAEVDGLKASLTAKDTELTAAKAELATVKADLVKAQGLAALKAGTPPDPGVGKLPLVADDAKYLAMSASEREAFHAQGGKLALAAGA